MTPGDPFDHTTAVRAVADTEHCPCGQPLDPTTYHDHTDDDRQLCEHCCPTCNTERIPPPT